MDLLGPDKLTIAEIQQMCNAGQLARAATAELEDLGKELASALADPGPGPGGARRSSMNATCMSSTRRSIARCES
jgi:hypothetical protein